MLTLFVFFFIYTRIYNIENRYISSKHDFTYLFMFMSLFMSKLLLQSDRK